MAARVPCPASIRRPSSNPPTAPANAASAIAPPNAEKLSLSERNSAICQTKTYPPAKKASAANNRMPGMAALSVRDVCWGTTTFGVHTMGNAASSITPAAAPKATRGPSVVKAQPVASGPITPTTAAAASRAPT